MKQLLLFLAVASSPLLAATAPDSIAGKVYRDHWTLGHTAGESTIVFGVDGRFVYLKNAYINAILGLTVPIVAPLSDGTYKYSRTSDTEATVDFTADDGTVSQRGLVFTNATDGRLNVNYVSSFFLTDLTSAQTVPARNVSLRGRVAPGQPLIVGLIIPESPAAKATGVQYSERQEVLIRVVGPSLLPFGITNAWSDPDFQIYKGSQKAVLRESHNPDWEGSVGFTTSPDSGKGLRKIFTYVGAFPLSTGSKDAVDVVRLGPGEYTIVCNLSASDAGGDVLIEAHFLP